MNDWLNHIVKKKPIQSKKFQRGVELCKISAEVCEGFLKLVVPKLRARDDVVVETYVRQRLIESLDLRLLVRLAGDGANGGASSGMEGTPVASGDDADAESQMVLPLRMLGGTRIDAALEKARRTCASY